MQPQWSEWARMVCKLMEIVGVHMGSSTISLGEVQQHQALFFLQENKRFRSSMKVRELTHHYGDMLVSVYCKT